MTIARPCTNVSTRNGRVYDEMSIECDHLIQDGGALTRLLDQILTHSPVTNPTSVEPLMVWIFSMFLHVRPPQDRVRTQALAPARFMF